MTGETWRQATAGLFLALLLAAGFGGWEEWPLTSWKLFAGLREDVEYGWLVTAVDPSGRERAISFADLPRPYRSGFHVAADLPDRPRDEQLAVCREWAAAHAEVTGVGVIEVRVYRTNRLVVRPGDPRPPPTRMLKVQCPQ